MKENVPVAEDVLRPVNEADILWMRRVMALIEQSAFAAETVLSSA